MSLPVQKLKPWWNDDSILTSCRDTSFMETSKLMKCMANQAESRGWSSLASRLNRSWLGSPYKHMRYVADSLFLKQSEDGGWGVFWKKKFLANLLPLKSLMNTAQGKVYILVTGPSAKDHDLSLLKNEKIIGGNGSIALLEKENLAAQYFVITDRDFFLNRMDYVKNIVRSKAHCFFSMNGIALICKFAPELLNQGNIYLLETVDRYYALPQIDKTQLPNCKLDWALLPSLECMKQLRIGWSRNMSKGVFTGCTVAYIAAQVAFSLGYNEINFIGMDLGGIGRAYDEGDTPQPTSLDKDFESMIAPSFQLMKEAQEIDEFTAYNLSPKTRLSYDVLPYKQYEDCMFV